MIDARTLDDRQVLETDLCIIGAGAAGISIALQFIVGPRRVLLVESGGWESDAQTDGLRAGRLSSPFPQIPDSYLMQSRRRYYGGTTNIWTGWCRPLDPIDFEQRDWVPDSGWPLTYAELQPWYRRAAELLQIPPFESTAGAEHPLQDSSRIHAASFHFSPPVRFGQGELRARLAGAENVTILLYGNLRELEPQPELEALRRARLQTLTGKQLYVHAKYFVLATGAVENARLLLASNGAQPDGLGNAQDLVGRYFMEHPHLKAGVAVFALPREDLRDYQRIYVDPRTGHKLKQAWALSAETQREQRLLNFCLVPYHRRHNRLWNVRDLGMQVGGLALQLRKLKNERAAEQPFFMDCEIRFEQAPKHASRVRLLEERDALDMPAALIDYRLDERDRDSMLSSLDCFGRELGRCQAGRLNLYVSRENPYPQSTFLAHHQLGTTRMSADAQRGVVNADCRMHQLRNLYVAGSSVFPTSGHANPTLTIVALSLRLAEHLRGELEK